jgi:nicotinamide mononucleotide transporter
MFAPSIEYAAVAFALLYVALMALSIRLAWLFGGLSSLGFLIVFWRADLPMQALLQVYYIAIAGYGFYYWTTPKGVPPVTEGSLPAHVAAVSLASVAGIVAGYLSFRATSSAVAFMDALISGFSVVATWMQARRWLSNWLYWAVLNLLGAGLLVQQKLYPSAALFGVYIVMSGYGYYSWRAERPRA